MDWYYAEENKRQIGPLSDDEFQKFVADGVVKPETLVWNEGMADWLPLSRALKSDDFSESGSAVEAQDEENQEQDEVVSSADELVAAVNRDGRQFEISTCLSYGWQLVFNGFFLLAGAALFVAVTMFVLANFVTNPIAFFLVQGAIQGPVLGGVFFVFISRIRGEAVGFESIFIGFTHRTTTLVLAGLVIAAPGLLSLPGQIALTERMTKLEEMADQSQQPDISEMLEFAKDLSNDRVLMGLILIPMLPAFYLSIILLHVIPLVVATGLSVRDAVVTSIRIVHSRFFAHLGLIILASIVSFAGLLACGIGYLLTFPVYFAMLAYGFESLFGGYRLDPTRKE